MCQQKNQRMMSEKGHQGTEKPELVPMVVRSMW
jgi:hypothetical protein